MRKTKPFGDTKLGENLGCAAMLLALALILLVVGYLSTLNT